MPLQLHDRDHRRRRRRRSGLSILRASLLAGYTMTSFRSSATSTPLRRMRAVAQFRHPLHWGGPRPVRIAGAGADKRDSHLADEGGGFHEDPQRAEEGVRVAGVPYGRVDEDRAARFRATDEGGGITRGR